jgi:DNA ligase-1
MKYPKLFKATATGAIQEWQIITNGDRFYTISGQVDGKKILSALTKCKGKNIGKANETTPEQQAEAEAAAKWTKKVDEGYTQDISQVGNLGLRVNPMLAKKYEDYKDHGFPVACQPKLDGLRCLITREGAYSRLWKPFATLAHISEELQSVFDDYPEILAFDGEMYSHSLNNDFEKIVSIVKQPKATQDDIDKCKRNIKYHIYDVSTAKPLSFANRHKLLREIYDDSDFSYIEFVDTSFPQTQDDLDFLYQLYLNQGYEGQMVRVPDSVYQQKRTKDLLKRKEFMDGEYRIVGYKEGKGGREGCIILELELPNGGSFDSVPVGPIEYLRRLWNNKDNLIGLFATVKYQNLSAEGVPRFNNTTKIRAANGEEVVL